MNKKLEVWTQYRLLSSFLGGYFSSFKKLLRQREICKKILRNNRLDLSKGSRQFLGVEGGGGHIRELAVTKLLTNLKDLSYCINAK